MNSQNEVDASFFDVVHQLIQREETHQQDERRGQVRHAFQNIQLMAPMENEKLPSSSDFQAVECYDISSSGFSFLVSDPPMYESLVVAFGEIPFKFLLAQVAGVRKLHRAGELHYRVGCQFTRRLNP